MSGDGIELPAGIALDDPRPIAAAAPYTYDLPWPDEIAALAPGDGVQAIFREIGGGRKYSAERMWVTIEQIADGFVAGYLDNDPFDMPSIKHRDRVRIPLTHVISCTYVDGKERPVVPERRRYWDRCFVDACVVEGRSHPDYLYREEPDNPSDSGWRFMSGTEDDAYMSDASKHSVMDVNTIANFACSMPT